MFLHQGALLFEVHVGRTAHHGTRLMACRQGFGHQRAGIENEVGFLQEFPSPHTNEFRVARTSSHDFDVASPHFQVLFIYRQGCRPVLALDFGNDQFSVVGAQNGCRLTNTGRSYMLLNGLAGVGHIHCCQFFSGKEHHLSSI